MNYKNIIEESFNGNNIYSDSEVLTAAESFVDLLNTGNERIAVKHLDGNYEIKDYLKKAILLYFKYTKLKNIVSGDITWFDKVPVKNMDNLDLFRHVPGAIIRYGAYVSSSAIVMPSFINIGAYIDDKTMIDSFTTIGSCAQIGKRCHISEGVCIGGVLEPVNSFPVIIEDDCFIGAKSAITEGIRIRANTIIAAGVVLTRSVKIINRENGEVINIDNIPENSLIVPGSYNAGGNININCAVFMDKNKNQDVINEFLR